MREKNIIFFREIYLKRKLIIAFFSQFQFLGLKCVYVYGYTHPFIHSSMMFILSLMSSLHHHKMSLSLHSINAVLSMIEISTIHFSLHPFRRKRDNFTVILFISHTHYRRVLFYARTLFTFWRVFTLSATLFFLWWSKKTRITMKSNDQCNVGCQSIKP